MGSQFEMNVTLNDLLQARACDRTYLSMTGEWLVSGWKARCSGVSACTKDHHFRRSSMNLPRNGVASLVLSGRPSYKFLGKSSYHQRSKLKLSACSSPEGLSRLVLFHLGECLPPLPDQSVTGGSPSAGWRAVFPDRNVFLLVEIRHVWQQHKIPKPRRRPRGVRCSRARWQRRYPC